MFDLTPLDVRKKKGDFRKILRGYDADEVDAFLDAVADRLEVLIKENATLTERSVRLKEQVASQEGRERAVHEALVTAQELRDKISSQAEQEADQVRKEARSEADLVVREAESKAELLVKEAEGRADLLNKEATSELEQAKREASRIRAEIEGDTERAMREGERRIQAVRESLAALERQRARFLKSYRGLLERELDVVEVEQSKRPDEEVTIDLELAGDGKAGAPVGSGAGIASEPGAGGAPAGETTPMDPVRQEGPEYGWAGAGTGLHDEEPADADTPETIAAARLASHERPGETRAPSTAPAQQAGPEPDAGEEPDAFDRNGVRTGAIEGEGWEETEAGDEESTANTRSPLWLTPLLRRERRRPEGDEPGR